MWPIFMAVFIFLLLDNLGYCVMNLFFGFYLIFGYFAQLLFPFVAIIRSTVSFSVVTFPEKVKNCPMKLTYYAFGSINI
jgi:hypothetical protein